MSLRRSARAPTIVPASSAQHNTNSSASSVSSGRLDRNGRVTNKAPSPPGSVAPKSRSPEELGDLAEPPPRRTRSSNDEAKDDIPNPIEDENEEENEEEETRCVCGQMEYPGLPITTRESSKDKTQVDSDPISEDSTGWFIQCDNCQVWQHGGCVGILDESKSPEKYYCEDCRKDLHSIAEDVNGRKHSRYLPVHDSSSAASSPDPKSKKTPQRRRESKASRSELEKIAKGRRPTMNSRDAAYDEAEQLRRAIEMSKQDSMAKPGGTRKGKRLRDESEEIQEDAKRRRTTPGSSSNHSKTRRQGAESEAEAEKVKNIRGAAARNHRAKEVREREAAREKENASKKKGQSHKKKADNPEASPEPASRTLSGKGAPPASKAAQPIPSSKSHKKGGRPPARRGKLGRNQYSKDRDPPVQKQNSNSPRSNNSHEGDQPNVNGGTNGAAAESNGLGKPSRPRHMNPNRTSMNDMKRRVAGILEFISHTQVELAAIDASRSRSNTQNSTKTSSTSTATPPDTNGTGANAGSAKAEMGLKNVNGVLNSLGDADAIDDETFGKLTAVEMMEVLTRRLMRWQGDYGKWS